MSVWHPSYLQLLSGGYSSWCRYQTGCTRTPTPTYPEHPIKHAQDFCNRIHINHSQRTDCVYVTDPYAAAHWQRCWVQGEINSLSLASCWCVVGLDEGRTHWVKLDPDTKKSGLRVNEIQWIQRENHISHQVPHFVRGHALNLCYDGLLTLSTWYADQPGGKNWTIYRCTFVQKQLPKRTNKIVLPDDLAVRVRCVRKCVACDDAQSK